MSIDAFVIGIFFVTIHLLANELIPADRIKRLRWLSFSGGLAVSYVFVYVLPSLHREQHQLKDYASTFTMESELYFIGLLGLLLFYGIENSVSYAQAKGFAEYHAFFWLQVGFFAFYNMLIAYTVMASEIKGVQAVFYGAAIGLHFIAVAHDLWRKDPDRYRKVGRYVLASGIFVGWGIGTSLQLSSVMQSLIFAFISGAMILNVLKNELPKERDAHFPTFAFAIISYTSVTLALKYFFEW
ncbi:hypothetical protein BKP35_17345 [Anaerobacillus arseniciselenatis]|uniref:Uncharacterized protein n=1 Tax=Anaerobacillus arseniciselenatis TaxID=85682 RepID=A0A1S2L8Z8_9BACI|nr:hypothetical protein [Anaerobacillus arseniciselenatis]OIJ08851.1 hypothetical protein BKP35_17345 [Anaerobacillus arseniciselenatis]